VTSGRFDAKPDRCWWPVFRGRGRPRHT
jgi:hypothetical protein